MSMRVLLLLLLVIQNRFFSQWIHLKIVLSWTEKVNNFAWLEDFSNVQVRILLMKRNTLLIGHLIPACVHVLCAYTWKYFIAQLHSPLLVGDYWISRHLVVENTFLWDNKKLQAETGNSSEIVFLSWSGVSTVRITVSGSMSRDHSKSSFRLRIHVVLV